MILVDGHMRLLEEENQSDLTSLLLNQLSMIERQIEDPELEKTKTGAKGKKQAPLVKKVLVVEHRCFFNELFH